MPALISPPTMHAGVGGAPEHPVRVPGLLHPGVVRVEVRLDLVVLRLVDEEELPAARAEDGRRRRVVDAVAERDVPGLLIGLRREHVGLAVDQPARDPERRRRRVERLRVGERPEADPAGGSRRVAGLGAVAGDRAQEVLGAVPLGRVLPGRRCGRPDREARRAVDVEVLDQRDVDRRRMARRAAPSRRRRSAPR